jgi:hypothetical protein
MAFDFGKLVSILGFSYYSSTPGLTQAMENLARARWLVTLLIQPVLQTLALASTSTSTSSEILTATPKQTETW